jgi:hypothetical protein
MSDTGGRGDAVQHVWNYFQIHAAQRMSVFNFFLIISALIATGLAATLQGTARFASLGIPLGLLLALIAFVFWKLDQRTSFLVKHAERALIDLECTFSASLSRVFQSEQVQTTQASNEGRPWNRMWSYGESFRLVFAVMAGTGIAGSVLSAARCFGLLAW